VSNKCYERYKLILTSRDMLGSQHSYGSSFYTGVSIPSGPFTQDPNTFSNDRSGSFCAYVPPSCGCGPNSTQESDFASGSVPLQYHTYNDASSQIVPHQPSAPKLIPHRCSSLTLDDTEDWVGAMPSTDQTSEQADDEANSCFEGSKDLDNEENDYDVDHAEFVIHDVKGVQHVEKPGRVRKDNGYLEWQNPKTKGWRESRIARLVPVYSMLTCRRSCSDPSRYSSGIDFTGSSFSPLRVLWYVASPLSLLSFD